MEHLSIDNGQLTKDNLPLQLNQIARVVLTTAKELFFDPYKKNKSCGSFILIDPITNNTSASRYDYRPGGNERYGCHG